MSKLARKPIIVDPKVKVEKDGKQIKVTGPLGTEALDLIPGIEVEIKENEILVSSEQVRKNPNLGLFRALLGNLVLGVTKGFELRLELIGVGYKGMVKGTQLELTLGFSHPCVVDIPEKVKVEVEKATTVVLRSSDKQVVGQFAANIRRLRPPEPYKGKGIRFVGEQIRRKAGKSSK
ncbi:MAG: 50S ribosomal protein L6 [Chlamydiia bacterium]|nr:50S ribosomal protein L6 [Chlamydiia bacterium]